jgi:hypothetical protein
MIVALAGGVGGANSRKAYQFSDGLARSGHWKSHRDAASRSAFHELN